MNNKVVIDINNISKRYRIGSISKSHDTFFEKMTSIIKKPFDNYKNLKSLSDFSYDDDNIFWALKDINFQVNEGEVLGIIGHNGAGKSTLLKILSRITEPSSGTVNIKGRVASLLEVGTGMHPDLTGRDNIYLNGSLLGMNKSEINKRFDEIVDFSGIDKFIDTPVKRFSSGMSVRLGFAVAAHLEPEILLIDEVLGVGDPQFREKSKQRILSLVQSTSTVVLVSHSFGLMREICDRVAFIDEGKVMFVGDPTKSIRKYFELTGKN